MPISAVRLRPPHAVVGKSVREVAKADLRPEFRCQSSETIGPAPRADAASDPDDDEGIVGEAVVPAAHARMFALCSKARQARAQRDPNPKSSLGGHLAGRTFGGMAIQGSNAVHRRAELTCSNFRDMVNVSQAKIKFLRCRRSSSKAANCSFLMSTSSSRCLTSSRQALIFSVFLFSCGQQQLRRRGEHRTAVKSALAPARQPCGNIFICRYQPATGTPRVLSCLRQHSLCQV